MMGKVCQEDGCRSRGGKNNTQLVIHKYEWEKKASKGGELIILSQRLLKVENSTKPEAVSPGNKSKYWLGRSRLAILIMLA